MRLGLLADIHEAVDPLASCLDALTRARVDSFVVLGDLVDHGERLQDTVDLLAPLPSLGVWGNHDFGLCGEVGPTVRARFPASVLEYFGRLLPWAEMEGCRFQHIDPYLDPHRLEDLWMNPSLETRVAEFARCSYRRVFVGHFHRWFLIDPHGEVPWTPPEPARLSGQQRYLISVEAVQNGWCAVFDTARDELKPIRVN